MEADRRNQILEDVSIYEWTYNWCLDLYLGSMDSFSESGNGYGIVWAGQCDQMGDGLGVRSNVLY